MQPAHRTLRVMIFLASLALLFMLLWLRDFRFSAQPPPRSEPTPTPTLAPTEPVELPYFQRPAASVISLEIAGLATGREGDRTSVAGIRRVAKLGTILPDPARFEITQYEVKAGDTLFGIAETYGLKPQTLMFGNSDTLFDDPHRLRVGQKLNILPVDGLLYTWHKEDGLNGVAKFFKVTPDDILNWPGNRLNPDIIGDYSNPNIPEGTVLLIPGGVREYRSWSAPFIGRGDPARAKIMGPGHCGVVSGLNGSGTFVWPTTERWVSGYDFAPDANHMGIDIAGQTGNPVYASDSGVVVYSGWNDWGYGYVIVIDHGNGYQTLYAHLSALYAGCGSGVLQGASIGALGSTGRSTGAHLHFEIMNSSGGRLNPWHYLSK